MCMVVCAPAAPRGTRAGWLCSLQPALLQIPSSSPTRGTLRWGRVPRSPALCSVVKSQISRPTRVPSPLGGGGLLNYTCRDGGRAVGDLFLLWHRLLSGLRAGTAGVGGRFPSVSAGCGVCLPAALAPLLCVCCRPSRGSSGTDRLPDTQQNPQLFKYSVRCLDHWGKQLAGVVSVAGQTPSSSSLFSHSGVK